MLKRLLFLLQTPHSESQLAAELEVSEGVLAGMLRSLERRGYIGRAFLSSPVCGGTHCSVCSLRNLCPAAGADEAEAVSVWRLAPSGKQALERGGQSL